MSATSLNATLFFYLQQERGKPVRVSFLPNHLANAVFYTAALSDIYLKKVMRGVLLNRFFTDFSCQKKNAFIDFVSQG